MNQKLQQLLFALKGLLEKLLITLQKNKPTPPIINPINVEPPASAPTAPIHASLIPALAEGIFEAEGNGKQAGMALNNRGDLKYTPYTKSLGAISPSTNNFAVFRTMEEGDQACRQLCTDAALGLLKAYPANCTLAEFVKIYAEPPNGNYLAIILRHVSGKVAQTKLSELL